MMRSAVSGMLFQFGKRHGARNINAPSTRLHRGEGVDKLHLRAARRELLIKAHVGVTTNVRVVAPGTTERSQGKAKRVVDLRRRE